MQVDEDRNWIPAMVVGVGLLVGAVGVGCKADDPPLRTDAETGPTGTGGNGDSGSGMDGAASDGGDGTTAGDTSVALDLEDGGSGTMGETDGGLDSGPAGDGDSGGGGDTSGCSGTIVGVDASMHCGCFDSSSCSSCATASLSAGTWRIAYWSGAVNTGGAMSNANWNERASIACTQCSGSANCWMIREGSVGGLPGFDPNGWPSRSSAERTNRGKSKEITLSSPTTLKFWYQDQSCMDNRGTIEYCITRVGSP